jgi:hypothetical protein
MLRKGRKIKINDFRKMKNGEKDNEKVATIKRSWDDADF